MLFAKERVEVICAQLKNKCCEMQRPCNIGR